MLHRLLPLLLVAASSAPAQEKPIYFSREEAGVGDPNPFYENGVYSIFYLKNEGRHPFWLTQSANLTNWSPPIEAIRAGGPEAPDYWTGSGSVIADPKGGYRLYYTGHHPQRHPKEFVMEAGAASLTGPWRKMPGMTFAGPPHYDARDFRDPFVFWNPQANAHWMLLATRRAGKAAIGLYTSADLKRWIAAPPLYEEDSPLNLEVPDLFSEGDAWYLLYSDQREQIRQVRYLRAGESTGPYSYGAYDALDGRAFYAGKSAGAGSERLLFGWLARKQHRDDRRAFDWGGDLVVHALRRTTNGELAVGLPSDIADVFTREKSRLSPAVPHIGSASQPLLVRAKLTIQPGSRFGIKFTNDSGKDSLLDIDTSKGKVAFYFQGSIANAPHVAFPVTSDGKYTLDLVVDPALGLAIAYINDYRALSFRFYSVANTSLSLCSNSELTDLVGSVRIR